ncbi:efflux RND transporter periplasmic adaptor subunit [Armatimonas sp.]|uniref:efflux RND transporter periplasmic adaptor subunit n=1 Tax=Armatimonas sp. TaxID=1872638 RepID=UPI00374D4EF4
MRPFAICLFALTPLVVITSGCVSQTGVQPGSPAAPTPIVKVQVTTPEKRTISRKLGLTGELVAGEQTTLAAKIAGYLGSVTVREGDRVALGQVLATLTLPELNTERQQAQQSAEALRIGIEGREARLGEAHSQTKRTQLQVKKAQAEQQQATSGIDEARAQIERAQAGLLETKASLAGAKASSEEAKAQVEHAEAELVQAEAEQKLTQLTLERYEAIVAKDKRLLAGQELDAARAKRDASRGKVEAAKSQVRAMQARGQALQQQVGAVEARLAQGESGLRVAEAALQGAKARQATLGEQTSVARGDVEVAKRQEATASLKIREGALQSAAGESAATRMAELARYQSLRAPFAGVVIQRHLDTGALVQPGTAILTVADPRVLRLRLFAPEAEASRVRPGTEVQVQLSGEKTPRTARISRTASALDPKTRTLLAEADMSGVGLSIGAFGAVKLILETHKGVLALPNAAVGSDKSGKFVFIESGGKVKRLAIKVGFDDGQYTEVTEGLSGSETVIVTGRDVLSGGIAVETTSWTPPTPTPAK